MFIGIIIILLLIVCLVIYGCSSTSIKEGLSSAPNPIPPPQVIVGPSGNIVSYNGKYYRTLSGLDPDGGGMHSKQQTTMPIGWKVADNNADSIKVIRDITWGMQPVFMGVGLPSTWDTARSWFLTAFGATIDGGGLAPAAGGTFKQMFCGDARNYCHITRPTLANGLWSGIPILGDAADAVNTAAVFGDVLLQQPAAPYVKPGTNIVVFNGREYRTIWDNKPDILPLVSPTTYMAEAKTAGITIFDNIYNNGGKGWGVVGSNGPEPAKLLATSQTAAAAQALQINIGKGLGSSAARIAAATGDLTFIESDGVLSDGAYQDGPWDNAAARGAGAAPTGAVPDGWQVADDNPDSVVVIKSFPWQSWMVYTNSGMSYWSKWWKAGGLELYAPTMALAVARAADPNAAALSASAVQAAAADAVSAMARLDASVLEEAADTTAVSLNSVNTFYSNLGANLATAENATNASMAANAGASYLNPDASVYSISSYNAKLAAAASSLDFYFAHACYAPSTNRCEDPGWFVGGAGAAETFPLFPSDLMLPLPAHGWDAAPWQDVGAFIGRYWAGQMVLGVANQAVPTYNDRQPIGAAPAQAIWSSGAFTWGAYFGWESRGDAHAYADSTLWFGGGYGVSDQQYPFGGSDPKSAAAAAVAVMYGYRAITATATTGAATGVGPAAVSPLGTAILLSRPICTCGGGTAATAYDHGTLPAAQERQLLAAPGGQYCTTPTENCASCNTGWAITGTLGSQTCVQDKCTCSNGTAATGSACTTSTENCASCNTGWAITGTPGSQTCVQDNCTCSNGTAATGSACTTSTENCTKCHTGWTLTGDPGSQTCVQNNCTCLNGTSTKGANCTINNTTQCASCNTGWTLTGSQTCAPNQCTCNTGTPAKGKNCTKNNATQCSSCKPGYYLSADNCLPNECTCSAGTGTAATGANCTKNGLTKCSKCASGYNMGSDNICAANQQCGSFDCPTGRQHKSDYEKIVCQGAKCQDGECCNPIPQATCSPFICPTNSTLNSNAGTIKCAGPSCTDNECCTPNPKPTCYGDNMKCPTNFFLKSNGQKIKCANYTCNTDECCSANATCRIVKCGAQFNPKPITTICQGATCEPTECCNPNAVCLTYPCPTGMRQKTNASSITCIGATCVTPECCDAIPPPPPPPSFIVSPPPPPPPSFIVSPPAPPPSFIVSPPPAPPPSFIVSPQPAAPPPPSNRTHITDVTNITDTTDDPTNIYFPNANFITFSNGESNDQSSPLDQNADNYSKYNGWSSPQQTSLARTNNMFSETPLPPPAGIASFNNRSYNQS